MQHSLIFPVVEINRDSSGWGGKDVSYLSSHIMKERLPPLHFHFLCMEMKSKEAPLVYIPHLVDKVAHVLKVR